MAFFSKITFAALLLMASLLSLGSANTSGIATFNKPPYLPSACYGYEDEGVMIAAANDPIFKGGAACGKYYQVTCVSGTNQGVPFPCRGSGTVTVMITDRCRSEVCRGDLDLSLEAFSSIADPDSGAIHISYKQV